MSDHQLSSPSCCCSASDEIDTSAIDPTARNRLFVNGSAPVAADIRANWSCR